MKIIQLTKDIATVYVSIQELNILKNALAAIQEVLPVRSFQVRVDYSHQRVKEFEELISKLITQESLNHFNDRVNIEFSYDEIKMFNNALNEICHGVNMRQICFWIDVKTNVHSPKTFLRVAKKSG